MRKRVVVPLTSERFELSCGDFVDLSWSQQGRKHTVIVLHGLGGTVDSCYMRGMMAALNQQGFNSLAMHFRGCSKEPNRHAQMFHAGHTCDLAEVIDHIKQQNPQGLIFAVGFSIGANILLKYLGERGKDSSLAGAVAISTPFLLDQTQKKLSIGFSRFYQQVLLTKLKMFVVKKYLQQKPAQIDLLSAMSAMSIRHFDELVTAPLHGFLDAAEYYSKSSSYPYIKDIQIPHLIINAKDDPFIPYESLPKPCDLSKSSRLLVTESGGHVGFVMGDSPNQAIYWLDQVVPQYLLSLCD